MLTRREDTHHLRPGHHCGHRHDPATERLAEDVGVGHDALVVARERPPGPAEARLDLVREHQHVALRAQPANLDQEPVGRDDHAALALDGLQQDGDRVLVDRLRERGGVPVRDRDESRRVGPEVRAGRRVVREADDRGRAAVEVAHHDDDLGSALGTSFTWYAHLRAS